jgi:hypothetical protein
MWRAGEKVFCPDEIVMMRSRGFLSCAGVLRMRKLRRTRAIFFTRLMGLPRLSASLARRCSVGCSADGMRQTRRAPLRHTAKARLARLQNARG